MSWAAARPGTWPAPAAPRTSVATTAAARMARRMSVSRRRSRRHGIERALHDIDLLPLGDDDLLREPLEDGVLAVAQLEERHVDGPLMMRDHHGGEITVGIAGAVDRHTGIHARHRGGHSGV